MDHGLIFIIAACVIGLWMTWGIGANDLANIMSTAMGSKAVSVKQAMIIAIVFEIAGAFLGGNEVSDTIRSGIIDVGQFANQPTLLIYVMLSVLLASTVWITFASCLGMPVSITNAIVGALVGVGAIMLGLHAIHWQTVGYVALSWVLCPTIAGVLSYLLFNSIRRWILGVDKPLLAAKKYIPIYLFLVGVVLAMMTTLKAVGHFHLTLGFFKTAVILIVTIALVMIIGFLAMRDVFSNEQERRHVQFVCIEKMFSVLMAFTACAMVFAHGSNDVAIAVGPVAGVIGLVTSGNTHHDGMMLNGIMLFGCFGVVLGLFMYGRKVIETVGSAITILTPSRAFAATLAAASVVVASTSTGIPVSATQTLVGAVFGVGLARGIDALNLAVIRNIFMSWIITIPAAAGLATLCFYLLQTFVP
ncbi:MAG TPA: inorganic phosphate transporter [Gammaproteobacteria bacterium]|nr:inorganic phosphate transporter [Gammaproteobacteria bacterium]